MASPDRDSQAAKKASKNSSRKAAGKKARKRTLETPAAVVKKRFGTKDGLVKEIEKLTAKKDLLAERLGEGGLVRVSNAKLLRLHRLVTEVSGQFGSRASLVDAYLGLVGRANDQPFKKKLLEYTLGRIWDLHGAARKRASRSGKAGNAAK